MVEHAPCPDDERRHEALRLRDRQAAERQRGARHRQARERVDRLDRQYVVLVHQPLDRALVGGRDVLQDDGLGGRQDQVHADLVHAIPQERPPLGRPGLVVVADAALLAVQAEKQVAVALRVPAHPVAVAPRLQVRDRFDGRVEVRLDERDKRVLAERVDEVLEPRVRADLAVAVVALRRDDGLERGHQLLVGEEAERRRRARERRLLAVRPPEAAANIHVGAR
mmetsp:Transcript_19551/g.60271  ORF Transcript_19551/g.60271 Transcript_19551/m.60271 type:complete len:224 (+) Transcript_19551:399-1070(+)